jgi:beta-lactamase regulating signal transducer with metallopeptidase domain
MTYYSEIASVFIRIAVNLVLVGTPISLGIFIVLKFTRAGPPRARYLLAVTAFFAAAALPFVLTVAPTSETPRHQTIARAEIPGTPLTPDIDTPRIELLPQNQPATTSVNLDSLVVFLAQPSLSIALLTLWLVGACLLVGREAASHLRVARARRQWTPAKADIRERLSWPRDIPLFVDNEIGPCALDALDPTVVIPERVLEELSFPAVRQIAHHELDHLKWRDPSVHAAMRLVCASLWFSAPLWYLQRTACLEREAASDRAAVNSSRLQPDIAAVEYAAALVSIARSCARKEGRRKHAWLATEIGNESGLNDRVRRLMAIPSHLTVIHLSFALATLLVCASSLTILPIARLEAKSNENVDVRTPQEQRVFSSQSLFKEGPSKEETKPARPATLDRPLLTAERVEQQDSRLAKPTPDAIGEDSVPARSDTASTATGHANTIQPVPFVQITDLESQMAALGYKNLTSRQLSEMRAYAVGPAYVAEMTDSGYSGLSADMLIRFKWLGVSSSYIKEMRTLGYGNLSAPTLVNFRQHGVNSDYIRQMRTRTSGTISAEQLVSLRLFGASTEFVDKLKALGYSNLNAEQLIGMRLQGVSIAFIEDLRAKGLKSLSADELIGMRMRGSN